MDVGMVIYNESPDNKIILDYFVLLSLWSVSLYSCQALLWPSVLWWSLNWLQLEHLREKLAWQPTQWNGQADLAWRRHQYNSTEPYKQMIETWMWNSWYIGSTNTASLCLAARPSSWPAAHAAAGLYQPGCPTMTDTGQAKFLLKHFSCSELSYHHKALGLGSA